MDLDGLQKLPDAEVKAELEKIKGIGNWTSDIYLLMAMLRPDVMPKGDLALHISWQEVSGRETRPKSDEFLEIAEGLGTISFDSGPSSVALISFTSREEMGRVSQFQVSSFKFQGSEVRSQKSEVRSQKSEVRSQKRVNPRKNPTKWARSVLLILAVDERSESTVALDKAREPRQRRQEKPAHFSLPRGDCSQGCLRSSRSASE